jgi:hypothetical protein
LAIVIYENDIVRRCCRRERDACACYLRRMDPIAVANMASACFEDSAYSPCSMQSAEQTDLQASQE